MSVISPEDFEKKLDETLRSHLSKESGTPSNLAESIRYSLLAPGKRIRPRLALECAKMLGLKPEPALAAAAAIEMVHCFTLIHDDLPCMDDDDFRRGRPSNHRKFGEALALLAGDALMALAVDSFLEAAPHVETRNFLAGFRRFSWAIGPRGVIGGQAAEALLAEKPRLPDLEDMHSRKTGALFSAALLIPKDFAGVADSSENGGAIVEFARELGTAFQVADDLEDLETKDPTSILFFMDSETAAAKTRSRLKDACSRLEKAWGEKASALTEIAGEVLRTLKPKNG